MSENLKTEDLPVVLPERFLRAMYYATNLSFLHNQLLQMRRLLYMIIMLLGKTVIFNVFIWNSLFHCLAQQTSCLVFITFITSYLLIDNNTQRCLSRVKLGLRRSWTHCLLVHSCSYLVINARKKQLPLLHREKNTLNELEVLQVHKSRDMGRRDDAL